MRRCFSVETELALQGPNDIPLGRVDFKRYASVDDLFADLEFIEERMDGLNVLIEACKRKVPDSN
jgi:hypothetical protein